MNNGWRVCVDVSRIHDACRPLLSSYIVITFAHNHNIGGKYVLIRIRQSEIGHKCNEALDTSCISHARVCAGKSTWRRMKSPVVRRIRERETTHKFLFLMFFKYSKIPETQNYTSSIIPFILKYLYPSFMASQFSS